MVIVKATINFLFLLLITPDLEEQDLPLNLDFYSEFFYHIYQITELLYHEHYTKHPSPPYLYFVGTNYIDFYYQARQKGSSPLHLNFFGCTELYSHECHFIETWKGILTLRSGFLKLGVPIEECVGPSIEE